MREEKLSKRRDHLNKATKRPRALGSLVAAIGASAVGLLGMLPSASANTNVTPAFSMSESTTQPKAAIAKLRLNKIGSQLQLAGGGGHESHVSHESHASHASHSSGGYR